MSRPGLIRADTLDLQNTEQPSAKDHSNQPTHGDPLGHGPPAPHQDASMRHVQQERSAEQEYLAEAWGSARSSHEGSELLDEETDFSTDRGAVPANMRSQEQGPYPSGGRIRSSEESDMTDADDDETVANDDMMDKISSSPSIDDGGSPSPYLQRKPLRKAFPLGLPGSGLAPRLPPPRNTRHHLRGRYTTERETSGFSDSDIGTITRPTIMDRPRPVSRFVAAESDDVFSPGTRPISPSAFYTANEGVDSSFLDPHEGRYLTPTDSETSLSAFLGPVAIYKEAFDEAIDIQDSTIYDEDDDDDYSDPPFPSDARFVDSGWGGECLRGTEDINFEFVYALHTFVATVEGQANATKGDTMVLLDDSNSYWWLVRVFKDSSIGYLPAEHIETPTERLARLNKHRNIDLSATMLSDNLEKSKNPLKKAMRRRNAKMVQFTTPTYYEASEVEWSDGENEQDSVDLDVDSHSGHTEQQTEDDDLAESINDPVTLVNEPRNDALAVNGIRSSTTESSSRDFKASAESERPSEESLDDGLSSRSRNGTIRNTDSFFKDNSAEPKKMSLTPTLLRESERSSADSPRSSESKEKSPLSETFDQMDKNAGISPTSEKFKDDKRRKEKKPGMLSGLFKRKDKKIKVDEAAGGTVRTQQEGDNILTSPTSISPLETGNSSPRERSPHSVRRQVSNGKLVKSPPASGTPSANASATTSGLSSGISSPPNGAATISNSSIPALNTSLPPQQSADPTPISSSIAPTSGSITPTSSNTTPTSSTPQPNPHSRQALRIQTQPQAHVEQKREGGVLSPSGGLVSSSSAGSKRSPQNNQRNDPDDNLSPEERDMDAATKSRKAAHTPPPRIGPFAPRQQAFGDDLVSPVDTANLQDRYPPALDHSSKNAPASDSPVSPTTPTESLSTSTVQTNEPYPEETSDATRGATSTAPSSTVPASREISEEPAADDDSEPEEHAWDDNALRTYLDESSTNDVKDMLWRIHDRTDATPVPLDHPVMLDLGYGAQQKQLDDMGARLDGLLSSFLSRSESRQRAVGAVP